MSIHTTPDRIVLAMGLAILATAFLILLPSQSQGATQSQAKASAGQAAGASELTPQPFVFLELFTSEGCSSCPSADRNLERIAEQASTEGSNVYTLSYHVDYWNRLGWTDPYSSAEHTARQHSYARRFDSDRVYTPQMVVNGQVEFVGSNQKLSDRAVEAGLEITTTAAIEIEATLVDGKVNVSWQTAGLSRGDAVNVALVQKTGTQQVTRGENARRELSHVNIVRQLQSEASPGQTGQMEFDTPEGFEEEAYHVIGFIQGGKSVTAAGKSDITVKTAVPASSPQTSVLKRNVSIRSTVNTSLVQEKQLVAVESFLGLLVSDTRGIQAILTQIEQQWDASYVPMILEVARFLPPRERGLVMSSLATQTGQSLGSDFDLWMQWNWQQEFKPHPNYPRFKSLLYSKIDPRFVEYFADVGEPTIRLDEVRWGGVRRDGIPPLKNPQMISVNEATYLSDTDVVFGIELNGDARAYPKRILAWHEMFKDTIGGQSVAGVY